MSPSLITSDPTAGFEHPYYLYVPDGYAGERPILVVPTNTGRPSDEFADHREVAEERVSGGVGRRISDRLDVPLLHPVFPRPVSDPVDWTHSIHQLCARTVRIEEGPLRRVDRQLLAMIDDARERLSDRGHVVPTDVMMNGFSAAAAFANRFSVLHPDRVRSVSAGGVNGIVTLPLEENRREFEFEFAGQRPLNYPVGVADVAATTGEPFDAAAFREVRQFVYMGEDDPRDVLLWPDVWTDTELRASAILTYGPDIHEDRFPHCSSVYEDENVSAVFRTYPEVGHDPTPAVDDIVTFHERSLAGDRRAELEQAVGGNPI